MTLKIFLPVRTRLRRSPSLYCPSQIWGRQIPTSSSRTAVCHERTDARRCDAVQEMEVGPPEPAVRGRLQTTASCDGQEPWW